MIAENLIKLFPDMKIAIIGSRGIPAKYGGFETFAFHISKILLQAGHDVTVVNEHDNSVGLQKIDGVNIIESRFKKSKNPLLFYFNSLRKTADSFDLIFVCGVGASLFYPLLKKKSSYILTNVDGLEHRRAKFLYSKKYLFASLSSSLIDFQILSLQILKLSVNIGMKIFQLNTKSCK